ncbi:MAG: tyrosine-type recombinase/integrase [Methylococcales bacterium]|nr:tyrosine-type recombinase/integrase [Methylococcales bacterium]
MTPHRLRHTFGTQLLNGGAKITTIQRLLGHQRLNTTLLYARVHDQTVADDYFRAMAVIEKWPNKRGDSQKATKDGDRGGQPPADQRLVGLVNKLEASGLADEQLEWLAELRAAL